MPTEVRLTPTSYIILGLINAVGECTPYDLKQIAPASVGQVWGLHHAQFYSEPQRLAQAGYLSERRESGGRRRRRYEVAEAGREALRDWLAEPTRELTKIHYPSMLKLVLGADPQRLAEVQLPTARTKLAKREETLAGFDPSMPRIFRLLGELAVEHEREMVRHWSRLAGAKPSRSTPKVAGSPEAALGSNSYFVLHLVESLGEATPYQLQRAAVESAWDFWTIPRAQLYSEPQRLAKAGYLSERRETEGRRRRYFKITAAGRGALDDWLAAPEPSTDELRDLATVQLFFGADPKRLAEVQLPLHEDKLEEYETAKEGLGAGDPPALMPAAEAGIASERIIVRFWRRLLEGQA